MLRRLTAVTTLAIGMSIAAARWQVPDRGRRPVSAPSRRWRAQLSW